MTLSKRYPLLLAALLLQAGAAQAADLAAAEPVEYVKICDAYGAGYFFIPGSSDTCLRISGYVRAYFAYQGRNQNNSSNSVDGNGSTDIISPVVVNPVVNGVAQTGTTILNPNYAFNYANYGALGNLTAAQQAGLPASTTVFANAETSDQYLSGIRATLRFDARTKTEFGILRSFFEFAAASSNVAKNGTGLVVRYGFVQFGPITAGVTDSFFDPDFTDIFGSPVGDRPTRPPVLAYTASLGNGVSVTLAAEDASVTGGAGGSSNLVINSTGEAWVRRSVQLPDAVANIRVVQSWGNAQISGAVAQQRFANTACGATVAVGGVCTANRVGWAVTAGTNIKLDAITKGDNFIARAVYTEGALQYIGNLTSQSYFGNGVADNTLSRRTGWAVVAEFNHYFTPAIRAAIIGAYARLGGNPGANFGSSIVYLRDTWNIYGQLFWTPVRGFDVGVELFYREATFNVFGAGATLGNRVLGTVADNGWGGFFRIQRSF